MIYDKEIEELKAAIKLSRACTGRVPRILNRRLATLQYVQLWMTKHKLAEGKLKRYQRMAKRFLKQMKKG